MKFRALLGGLALALSYTFAHAASLVVLPQQLVVDASGEVRSGAKLYVFDANTTTPRTAYETSELDPSSTHSSPILSISSGLFPSVYVDPAGGPYKLVLKDENDVTIYTEDDIPVGGSGIDQTAEETSAGVVAVNLDYPPGYTARYNATCDGSADDTAEVQMAIDYAEEVGGEAVVQAGTCLVGTLTLDASNVTIRGQGRGSILKAATSIAADCGILVSLAGGSDATTNQALLDTACPTIDVRSNVTGSLENVHIRDLSFEGNANAIRGIWMTGFTRGCTIANNYFDNIDGASIALNGSWSFSLLYNHVEADGDLGTGIQLGVTGNGTRSSTIVVNAPTIIGNELNNGQVGMEWDFGAAGFVGGNIFEFNDGDGFESQSVVGISVIGNYFEGNGGDNLDMGGTACDPDDKENTDCAESWQVIGNNFTQTTAVGGSNIRLDGVVTSRIGPNRFSGDKTQHYNLPSSAATHVEENEIWIPDISSTYATNSSELTGSTNYFNRFSAGAGYILQAPILRAVSSLVTASGGTLGLFGVTAVTRQADIGALTEVGTGNDVLQDVTGSHDQTILNNNFSDLAEQINDLRTALQNYGLLQ